MRIQFCGADRTVTGSAHLLEVNGLRVLLDCGMYQGKREEARRINQYLPFDPATLDAVVLTHGHLDHCGKLPVLPRNGFRGPVYCTAATAEVARIVLADAAEIQVEDAQYLNRRTREPGEEPVAALYTPDDLPEVMRAMKRVHYAQRTDLGKGVSFTFFDAGHILGSAYVVLEWQEAGRPRKLLFTGDIGRYGAPILRDPQPPPGVVDHVITESTYGNAAHGPIDQVGPQLLDAVKFCIERGSRLIIPSFAVGRTQTVLWYLKKFFREKQIPEIPVFVDSPMGVEATKATRNFPHEFDDETAAMAEQEKLFSGVVLASSTDQSKQINKRGGPVVIVASSPTCEFGRVLHHLRQSIEEQNDLVVFVGFTPYNTLGRRLQDGQKRVRILDQWYDVKCQVRTIHGLSAHGDRGELLRFLAPALGPQTTAYVVHGEVPQAESFAQSLLERGVANAVVPAMESSVVAYTGATFVPPPGEPKRTDME
jgi:metallo-beta-lactamase family protein